MPIVVKEWDTSDAVGYGASGDYSAFHLLKCGNRSVYNVTITNPTRGDLWLTKVYTSPQEDEDYFTPSGELRNYLEDHLIQTKIALEALLAKTDMVAIDTLVIEDVSGKRMFGTTKNYTSPFRKPYMPYLSPIVSTTLPRFIGKTQCYITSLIIGPETSWPKRFICHLARALEVYAHDVALELNEVAALEYPTGFMPLMKHLARCPQIALYFFPVTLVELLYLFRTLKQMEKSRESQKSRNIALEYKCSAENETGNGLTLHRTAQILTAEFIRCTKVQRFFLNNLSAITTQKRNDPSLYAIQQFIRHDDQKNFSLA